MALIPEKYLDQLRAAGLLVSDPYVSEHIAFPDGVSIAKPVSVPGHSLSDIEGEWGSDGTAISYPGLYFHRDVEKWVVTSHDYIPGPGPGDFIDNWDTAEEAVADILDFYFGSPARMDVKREARSE